MKSQTSERRVRVLLAKPGLDGHDAGARFVARVLRDAGMEVIYMGIRQTPEQIVQAAVQEDVDVIGLSILSGAHMEFTRRILRLLKEEHMDHVTVLVGGIIPSQDKDALRKMGVKEVFTPGAMPNDIVNSITRQVRH